MVGLAGEDRLEGLFRIQVMAPLGEGQPRLQQSVGIFRRAVRAGFPVFRMCRQGLRAALQVGIVRVVRQPGFAAGSCACRLPRLYQDVHQHRPQLGITRFQPGRFCHLFGRFLQPASCPVQVGQCHPGIHVTRVDAQGLVDVGDAIDHLAHVRLDGAQPVQGLRLVRILFQDTGIEGAGLGQPVAIQQSSGLFQQGADIGPGIGVRILGHGRSDPVQ